MKKLALALALALAISPLTFAQKTDSPPAKKSAKKHKKGKHSKTSAKTAWRRGPNGVWLYKL